MANQTNGLKTDFSILRYANCWEDADLLLDALQLDEGMHVACVASAGDNALALLSTNPARVSAFDISEVQLHLTALKAACFSALDYEEMLQLLGAAECSAVNRLDLFKRVAEWMNAGAVAYWKSRMTSIKTGVIHTGKFERYFQFFRRYLLPLAHTKKETSLLLKPRPGKAQADFFAGSWNNARWRMLMRIFFSRFVMGRYGRDPEFLRHVSVPVHRYIRGKAEAALCGPALSTNYMAHYIFTGSFGPLLPFYLRRENFEVIRANISKLILHCATAEQMAATGQNQVLCLSNIFEYYSPVLFQETAERWSALPPGTRIAFWNLMARRSFAESMPERFLTEPSSTVNDKGFFYSRFFVEQKR